jgi:hypothetical protein
MAIKQGLKRSDELNLDNLANPGTEQVVGLIHRAALFKVDISGKILNKNVEGIFLLNPATWDESKASNWIQHNIPGQSDPVFQWTSSGPRTVTFDALVTTETSDYKVSAGEKESEKATPKKTLQAVADYAVSLFNVSVPTPPPTSQYTKNEDILDISNRLNYYRSLAYPSYTDPNAKGVPSRLKSSPPLLVLFAGNSLSSLAYSDRITNKQDVWVLTNYTIRITKQLSNLIPIEAVVSFTLVQYNIRSFDSNRFYKDTR